jgi:hypothetical protein
MNKTKKKLKNLSLENNKNKKIINACDAFKYVYKNRASFNSLGGKAIFIKTVLKKAIEFYNESKLNVFYEWMFKFRNYISLIDKNFNMDILNTLPFYSVVFSDNTFQV